ncbi:MAG TPA: CRISPR-associated endonuclease Cas2 [Thermomicrobiales bacterium]|nr:CRISPR-associated endonuclease Cas2 [Thermomicrobiales bacterium]
MGEPRWNVLVTYDISTETLAGQRRLRRIADVCLAYGQRVQKSVFECTLTPTQYARFEQRLLRCIDEEEDRLRIYRLYGDRERYLTTYGSTTEIDLDEPLVI